MRDVFALEPATQVLADDSYVVSYPYLLSALQLHATESHPLFADAAHFVKRPTFARFQVGKQRTHRPLGAVAVRQQLIFLEPYQVRNALVAQLLPPLIANELALAQNPAASELADKAL